MPWRRKWHPTPVLLPGKSHGWRSLVDYSPWGHKELDTTERLHFHFLSPKVRGFPVGLAVKNWPAMQETPETQVRSLGQEDPLEEGMATHSNILAWRIPWPRSLAGYNPQGRKELDTTEVT